MICAIVLSLNRNTTNCKNQLVALPFLDEDEFYKHAFDRMERPGCCIPFQDSIK